MTREMFYKRDIWNWHIFLNCHNCGVKLEETISKHHAPIIFCGLKCLMEWRRAYSTLMGENVKHRKKTNDTQN